MIRRVVLLVPTVLFALLISGCGPTQSELEKSIRDEMKSGLNVTIKTFDLKKQSDGSYTGTATAENGDVYEITTGEPKGTKIEWKATPGQALVERTLRTELEQKLSSKVTSLQLTKGSEPGKYSGRADLEDGRKVNVSTHMDGKILKWEARDAVP